MLTNINDIYNPTINGFKFVFVNQILNLTLAYDMVNID